MLYAAAEALGLSSQLVIDIFWDLEFFYPWALSTLQERQRELAELAGGDSGDARDFAASLLQRQTA